MWGKNGANLKKVSLSDAIAVCSLRETSPRLWRIRLVGFFVVGVDGAPSGMRCTTTGRNVETAKAKKEEKICRHENN